MLKLQARINPGNRTIDTQSVEYKEWNKREHDVVKGSLLPSLRGEAESGTDFGEEKWGSKELAILATADGLARQLVAEQQAIRGIGWPLDSIVIRGLDGIVKDIEFVDDPEVPMFEVVVTEIEGE